MNVLAVAPRYSPKSVADIAAGRRARRSQKASLVAAFHNCDLLRHPQEEYRVHGAFGVAGFAAECWDFDFH
jgi:hypothetical protein